MHDGRTAEDDGSGRKIMSTKQPRFLVLTLVCLALTTLGTASASVHFSIGFGTRIGPCHPMYGWHAWPHWGWYDPWYDCGPVVFGPPVVVTRRRVIVEEHRLPPSRPPVESNEPLSEALLQKRSGLLKKLRIGDVRDRTQAVWELAQFADDDNTRAALERAPLSDRDAQVRKATAEMFAGLKNEKTLSALKRTHAEDAAREVRQAAYRAIIMIEGYPLNSN